ncbi:hypothetical protein [Pseudonocardia parietis]|uniref:Uncharacterized protein n=1 Tax=Pseudonocardia parietis TaxID=570936 RepID=A0ABS4W5Q0_9PSEU|nr:hypothetical protein [Pseudonocardia parietis]MBP2371243.1 hypothetical protein [Pseudonocardia parietis]
MQQVVAALFCNLAAGIVSLALLGGRGQLTPLHHHERRWPRVDGLDSRRSLLALTGLLPRSPSSSVR